MLMTERRTVFDPRRVEEFVRNAQVAEVQSATGVRVDVVQGQDRQDGALGLDLHETDCRWINGQHRGPALRNPFRDIRRQLAGP